MNDTLYCVFYTYIYIEREDKNAIKSLRKHSSGVDQPRRRRWEKLSFRLNTEVINCIGSSNNKIGLYCLVVSDK